MNKEVKLAFLLQYHQNLISKLNDEIYSRGGISKISKKITKVENIIEIILIGDDEE